MAWRSVLLILAVLLVVSLLPPPEPGAAAGTPLYPDLKTTNPAGLYFDRVTMGDGSSHYVLRFSNTVWNAGEGRLELEGDPNPSGSNLVYQNLYDSPTAGVRVVQKHVSSDLIYHPSHYHYHFQGFASYLLLQRDSAGVYQPTTKRGTKTGFCIMDVTRVTTNGPTYGKYWECGDRFQGLSVGWGDVYDASLPDQWIDLGTSRLPDGNYAVQSIADPQNKLEEGGRDQNNVGTTYFTVSGGVISLQAPPTTASCAISPLSGASGSSATVTCSNFHARETVEVYWRTTSSTPLAKATADKTGRAVITFTVPQGINSGYAVIVQGVSSRRQDTVNFTVNNPVVPTPTPDFLIPPGSNPTFSGSRLSIASSWSSVPSTSSTWAHDGSLSSHWYTFRAGVPTSAILTFDLGGTRQLSGVKWTYRLPEMDSMVLQVSPDGTNWTTVSTTTARAQHTWEGSSTKAQARYVRMVFNNPSGRQYLGYVSEVQIWGSTTPITSAPVGSNPTFIGTKIPIVSSSSSVPSTLPSSTYDGSLSTHWYTYQAGVPTNAIITFDLGTVRRLSGVKWTYVLPEMDTMTLQTSLDGVTWSTISVTTARARHTWEGSSTIRSARYVRMVFNNPSGRKHFGYVSEVQIWGSVPRSTTSSTTSTTALRTTAVTPTPTATVMASPQATGTPGAVPASPRAATPTTVPVEPSTPAEVVPGTPTEAPPGTPAGFETPTETTIPTETVETPPMDPVIATGTVVTADGGPLVCRTEPVTGTVITELASGTPVSITGPVQDGWYPVVCANAAGWVSADAIVLEGEGTVPPDQPTVEPTSSAVEPTPTETPVEPAPTEIPVEPTPTEIPVEPVPTEQAAEAPVVMPTPEPEPVIARREQIVNAAADSSVTVSGTPSDPTLLQVGGADQAMALVSFDVSGIESGTVVTATLVLTGAESGPAGTVTVLPGVRIDESSATWATAQNGIVVGQGGWITGGAQTTVDVTGYVTSDGVVTFVITGSPEEVAAITSRESGVPAYLVLVIEEVTYP